MSKAATRVASAVRTMLAGAYSGTAFEVVREGDPDCPTICIYWMNGPGEASVETTVNNRVRTITMSERDLATGFMGFEYRRVVGTAHPGITPQDVLLMSAVSRDLKENHLRVRYHEQHGRVMFPGYNVSMSNEVATVRVECAVPDENGMSADFKQEVRHTEAASYAKTLLATGRWEVDMQWGGITHRTFLLVRRAPLADLPEAAAA